MTIQYISQEQFDHAWKEISKHYNSIGAVLDMLAIAEFVDFYDEIEGTRYFRQTVKKNLNEMKRIAESYERQTMRNYGDKFSLWVDYIMAMQEALKQKVFVVYNSIHRFLSTRNVKNLQLTAKALTVQVLLNNSVEFHTEFFDGVYKRTKIRKFGRLYSFANLTGMMKRMQPVCHSFANFPNDVVNEFAQDKSIGLAVAAINNYLDSEDNLNNAAKIACSMDMETYGDVLKEIEEDEKARIATEKEKTAAADRVAAEMKKEAESAKLEAVRTRLSNKFKVSSL